MKQRYTARPALATCSTAGGWEGLVWPGSAPRGPRRRIQKGHAPASGLLLVRVVRCPLSCIAPLLGWC